MANPFRWILKSIRRKAIVGLLAILLSTVFLISLTMASQASKFIFSEVQRRAAAVARFVSGEVVRHAESDPQLAEVDTVLTRICDDPEILYVTLVDSSGRVLSSGCTLGERGFDHSLPMSELYDMGPGDIRYNTVGDILEVYRTVTPSEARTLFLVMGFDVGGVDAIVARITRLIAVSALVVYLLGLLVLVIGVNRMTAPLENLSTGMADIGSGKLPERLTVHTQDELGTLTASFNRMIDDLGSYRQQVDRYQRHLEDMVKQRTEQLNRVNVDLTQANRELQDANEKLLELDKLKSNFLGIATHELKTPITVIEGYLDSLVDGYAGDLSPVQIGIVDEALLSCRRMSDLVNDMLDVTRIESGKMPIEPVRSTLKAVVDRVAAQMAPLLERKTIRLTVRPDHLEDPVRMDEERIFQVFVNLISNAIKFTPVGGTITLSAAVNGPGRMMETTVADTGIGIAPHELPVIFDEFAQVGPPGKEEGTGLGLAICKGIIEAHGGRIWASSTVGEGTRFTFSLPLDPDGR